MSDSEPWAYHADGTPVLSLADIIRKQAAATPGAVALSRAGQAATFTDIDAASSRAAAALRAAGVDTGDRVVFIGTSGPLFAEVMYGTAKCGGIFAPVNSRLAEPEIMGILADAEPAVVVAEQDSRTADWSALSHIVYGASPIPLPVLREAVEVIGCSFIQSYGLTESTGGFTLLGPADHVPEEAFAHRLVSAGRPMAGARVRVVDPVTLEDRAPGERGEVLVAGSRVMKGYWRKPGQTAEIMLPGGWLRTGDGGSFDADGYLYLHDRLKDMLISGGENVYPAEVESVMTGHPAVAEVAVVGVPSDRWGESPFAAVVLRPGAQVTEEELIAWTRERLAHYKCPAGVSFVTGLARTASGKLQKHAIRAALLPQVIPCEQVAR